MGILVYMKIYENYWERGSQVYIYIFFICSMWYKRDGETFHTFFPKKWIDEDPRLNQTQLKPNKKLGGCLKHLLLPRTLGKWWHFDKHVVQPGLNISPPRKTSPGFCVACAVFWGDRIWTTQQKSWWCCWIFWLFGFSAGKYTPLKANMDTKNSHICKEIYLKDNIMFGIYVRFRVVFVIKRLNPVNSAI